jgi:hypothetical protein
VDGMQRLAPGAQVKPVAVASATPQPGTPPAGLPAVAADAATPEAKREGTP